MKGRQAHPEGVCQEDVPLGLAALSGIVRSHPILSPVLERFDAVVLPDAWLVAGAVAQSVWNASCGRPPAYGLKDLDIVYFDAADLAAETEAAHEERLRALFADLPVKLDVKNEARVHLWYKDVFGNRIDPYVSTADAIATFPTTATSIGVRPDGGRLRLCAPFGLDDLLAGVVRANKRQITRAVYEKKTARWRALWPELTYVGWDE
jgi:uncharacterized protein